MSFELPRANRSLRFTGEVKVPALGRKREKPPSGPDVYKADPPTPYIGARPSVRSELAERAPRSPFESIDDAVTTAMVRDDLIDTPKAPKPPKHPGLAVPNFRRQASPPEPAIVRLPRLEKKQSAMSPGLTFLVWAFVAIIGGAASYRFAPEIVENVKTAVKLFE